MLDENGEVISCNRCKHAVPVIYRNKERRVCNLANRVTVKCITGSREYYEPMEGSNGEYI